MVWRHYYREELLKLGYPSGAGFRDVNLLFNDSSVGILPIQMVFVAVMYFFLPSAKASVEGPAFTVEGVKLYLERIFFGSDLLGDVTGVAPERELVGVSGGGVRAMGVALHLLRARLLTVGHERGGMGTNRGLALRR